MSIVYVFKHFGNYDVFKDILVFCSYKLCVVYTNSKFLIRDPLIKLNKRFLRVNFLLVKCFLFLIF